MEKPQNFFETTLVVRRHTLIVPTESRLCLGEVNCGINEPLKDRTVLLYFPIVFVNLHNEKFLFIRVYTK